MVEFTDAAAVTSRLVDLSGRMLRFEPVSPAEVAAYTAMRDRACGPVPTEEDR